MSLMYLMIGLGIVLSLFLVVLIYVMSPSGKARKIKKRDTIDVEKLLQSAEGKLLKSEKQAQALRQEVAVLEKTTVSRDKELALEKAKVKKLQEKISQEKEWHDKEQTTIDKRGKEIQQLKTELLKVQEQFAREHSQNLRLNQEAKEAHVKMETLTSEKRAADFEKAQAEAKIEAQRKGLVALKKENMDLTKKKEDISWIAKTEYDKIKALLEEKEKELARMKRE